MKPEAQRIAIARACGWKQTTAGWWYHDTLPDNGGAEPAPPDYLNDLNAMHLAEETLTNEEMHAMNESMYLDTSIERVWRATAPKRAEHLLKIKGLWKE